MPQLTVRLPEDIRESVSATELGGGLWRLDTTPLMARDPLYQGDVLHLRPEADGSYSIEDVHARANERHGSWVVGRGFVDSTEYLAFEASVAKAGGRVEALIGGLLRVHTPAASTFDAEGVLDQHLAAFAKRNEPLLARVRRWFTGRPFQVKGWPD